MRKYVFTLDANQHKKQITISADNLHNAISLASKELGIMFLPEPYIFECNRALSDIANGF